LTGESTITLSVLDRLIDREPELSQEPGLSRMQSVRILRAAVRRDLESLLNTRRIAVLPSEGFDELNRSVYLYGLPDLSTLNMSGGGDRNRLLKGISDAINLFEPRLTQVTVSMVENPETVKTDVRLRIEALLRMDPVPEPVSFDSVLELQSGACRISGGDNA
jgi:type VI secretion system protein ImpF